MKYYLIKTLGCKANLYDSNRIEAELQAKGWLPKGQLEIDPNSEVLCIVNSCTVTDEADRQSRKLAARLIRDYPRAQVVLTGCAAEVNPALLAKTPGVHALVVSNREKHLLVDRILEQVSGPMGGGVKSETAHPALSHASKIWDVQGPFASPALAHATGVLNYHTRTFLKIQEGCNSFCTYCIIPYGRGTARSLPLADGLAQVQALVASGVQEIILTGTNLGDYGRDGGQRTSLEELVRRILGETDVPRLRVSSLDPTEVTPALVGLMRADSRFCPHFHVSLQHTEDRILRLMKRKYRFQEVSECFDRIASIPTARASQGGVFVGMDYITGFPEESEAEFHSSFKTLESLPWTRLHVFPYSEREGTPATRLPNPVPKGERIKRARILGDLSLQRLRSHYEKVFQEMQAMSAPRIFDVLFEQVGRDGRGGGHTPGYLHVIVDTEGADYERNTIGDVVPLRLETHASSGEMSLVGRPILN
ncbi:tRNA (N(6)-L-threonylcarbamoyladenosine(37)-C(2))-methylthiotransferase MtaB [Bdellovibrionota bacterium FG-2]